MNYIAALEAIVTAYEAHAGIRLADALINDPDPEIIADLQGQRHAYQTVLYVLSGLTQP